MTRLTPVVETLGLMAAVSGAYWLLGVVADPLAAGLFVLGPDAVVRPWSLFGSVYAHAGLGHLLSNAVVVAVAGAVVAGGTTRARFHAFFLGSGVLAGVAQVVVVPGSGVLGASGGAFALVGHVLATNPAGRAIGDALPTSSRASVAAVAGVALVLTLLLSGPGSAVVAHFAGAAVGLAAGGAGLLDPG